MGIPSESSDHMMTLHGPVAGHDVFDGRGKQMAIVREPYNRELAIRDL